MLDCEGENGRPPTRGLLLLIAFTTFGGGIGGEIDSDGAIEAVVFVVVVVVEPVSGRVAAGKVI